MVVGAAGFDHSSLYYEGVFARDVGHLAHKSQVRRMRRGIEEQTKGSAYQALRQEGDSKALGRGGLDGRAIEGFV